MRSIRERAILIAMMPKGRVWRKHVRASTYNLTHPTARTSTESNDASPSRRREKVDCELTTNS